ncbi:DUF4956 domain-containing protein [Actinomadura darangshiensis]|uniref:DUF4956 domain-containing protein n=1 Tax=Actinomadura darangshiensis TaxID=705336 RepID=A0A4R5B4D6_9ACTN|nr:DUF4956 domain-containing protein [Actinomadura darangshiensis]TDD80095.1 DUF4956 domain-containing protein [Actinomadura darangshiensis]
MLKDVGYGLAVDLVTITVLAHLIYFLRHRRRDMRLAYIAVNVGVFTVVSLLLAQRADLAIGFGLFGVLSIIRLRSGALTQEEVGYYFVALALGLVNGLATQDTWLALTLDAVLLAVMYAADHPRLPDRTRHRLITLDVIHRDDAALRADLENRLGGTVLRQSVTEVDYVRDVMVVDVRFRVIGDVRKGAAAPASRTEAVL